MNKLQVNQAILLGYSGYSGYKRQRYISPSVQNFKTTYTKYTHVHPQANRENFSPFSPEK